MAKQAFPYPGGKSRMADDIIDVMPDHECYVEPFGGGAAVLLQKPESSVEVYNDISGDLVNFFEIARDRTDELVEWLEFTPYSRKLHNKYVESLYGDGDPPEHNVERAGLFFYLQRSSFGGKTHHKNSGDVNAIFKPPQLDGENWRDFSEEYRESIKNIGLVASRFLNVTIECESWEYVVERYNSPTTLFYFDPPYVGGEGYYNESFEHDEFVESLSDISGHFILSYGDELPTGLTDYHIRTDSIQKSIGNKDADGDTMSERLIMNFDPDTSNPFAGANQARVDQFL